MIFRLLIAFTSALYLCACSQQPASESSPSATQPITVVATIFPLADWAAQIGGKHVQVVTLIPAGSSPHTFEPSPRQMRQVGDATLFLKVGLHLDEWATRLSAAGSSKLKLLSLGDDLLAQNKLPDVSGVLSGPHIENSDDSTTTTSAADAHEHEHDENGVNPHYWLDPSLASLSVDQIQQALSAADPAHAQDYAQNASNYKALLEKMDQQLSATLAPCKQRSFVSFHNGFAYLAARYGLKVAGVIEEYPGKTPSDRHVKRLADKLRALNAKVVFAEPQMNPRVAEILASEIGGTVDWLDPEGAAEYPERNSYVKLMEFNVKKLKEALCR